MTNSYITPITDRTYDDVVYARNHQDDLENQNKGAWNYTDANRVCNNLKYAAEWMYEQGFFDEPYSISVKTNWKETDIMTYEDLNDTIINTINDLKSYSRSDLTWYTLTSIANMDYRIANWIELDIDALATQEPLPADTYELTVENGSGSGAYEAGTVVTISAYAATGKSFSYWSGDHLENIADANASTTTYTMPYEAVTLTANYSTMTSHTLTVVTNSGTETAELYLGDDYEIQADPAPTSKTFYEWTVSPEDYEENLYEPAASTTFTMPDEDVTLTAVYITPGTKHLVVTNGTGTGYYEYGEKVSISASVPSGSTFTTWYGDTQYLSSDKTVSSNIVVIPDVTTIKLTANYSTTTTKATNVPIIVEGGTITTVNGTAYNEEDYTLEPEIYVSGYMNIGLGDTSATLEITTGVAVASILSLGDEMTINVVYTGDDITISEYSYINLVLSGNTSDSTTISGSTGADDTSIGYTGTLTLGTDEESEQFKIIIQVSEGPSGTTIEFDGPTFNYVLDETEVPDGPVFTEGDKLVITADDPDDPDSQVFEYWTSSGDSLITVNNRESNPLTVTVGENETTITSHYRTLSYHTLTVTTNSGTTIEELEAYDWFTVKAAPYPSGYTFVQWTGDTKSGSTRFSTMTFKTTSATTSTYMGTSDRDIVAEYREIVTGNTLTVIQPSGETTYTQDEFTTVKITAEDAEDGQAFKNWTLSGSGSISSSTSSTTTYTFSSGDATLTSNYGTVWTVTIVNGYYDSTTISSKTVFEGNSYSIKCRSLAVYEKFDGWTIEGEGTITNTASTSTTFTVGSGDATITANISNYPDKTLTIYYQDPDSVNNDEDDADTSNTTYSVYELTDLGGEDDAIEITSGLLVGSTLNTGDTMQINAVWTRPEGSDIYITTSSFITAHVAGATSDDTVVTTTMTAVDDNFATVGYTGVLTLGEDELGETLTVEIDVYQSETGSAYVEYIGPTFTFVETITETGSSEAEDDSDYNVGTITLVSKETYTYGTSVTVQAPVAPSGTSFLTWLGDVTMLSPNALASTARISSLTSDTILTATYYYPEGTSYYLLTVYNGTPSSETYKAGTSIAITANDPADGWAFKCWTGDTSFLVDTDLTQPTNTVLMPKQAVTLYATYYVEGDIPLYEIAITGGTATGSYTDAEGNTETDTDSIIHMPSGTPITLTPDADTTGHVFAYWSGYTASGITDFVTNDDGTATFTMVANDVAIVMHRRELNKATIYATNANEMSVYPGTYTITGTLQDTDDYHYTFTHWTCVDVDGNDCSSVIADTTELTTTITVEEGDIYWIEAHYTTYYRLTVVNGQDTGSGYYAEGEVVSTITVDDPPEADRIVFDYWDDPMGVISSTIYDATPIITMKDTVATITAVYVSIDTLNNSIAVTGDDLSDEIITRSNSYLITGLFTTGTLVFDKDGCMGVITNTDIDENDDTEDYGVEKLFYGGNS